MAKWKHANKGLWGGQGGGAGVYSLNGFYTFPVFAQTDDSWEPAFWTQAGETVTATRQQHNEHVAVY